MAARAQHRTSISLAAHCSSDSLTPENRISPDSRSEHIRSFWLGLHREETAPGPGATDDQANGGTIRCAAAAQGPAPARNVFPVSPPVDGRHWVEGNLPPGVLALLAPRTVDATPRSTVENERGILYRQDSI